MNSLLAEVVVWFVGLWMLLMIVLEGYALLQWLTGALIMSASWLVQAAWQCFVRFLIWLLVQLRKRILKVFGAWLSWWPALYQASRLYMKLVWLYLIKGRKDFDSFEDFKNDWNEFKQDQGYQSVRPQGFPRANRVRVLTSLGSSGVGRSA